MNGLQGRKVRSIESRYPGCLGRVVNPFDPGAPASGNNLLADNPRLYGSSPSSSGSDVVRKLSSSLGEHKEDKVIVSELRRSAYNKVSGIPMKKLLAQAMSKEVDHKQNPPNVVAKLMGLDTLPQERYDTAAQRSKSTCYSQCSSSPEAHKPCNKYKDVYEIWQPSPKTNHSRDSSPRKGRYDEDINEKQVDLVRQKFIEAKQLVTDEKFHQSKEFQDALEVLSSNKDLFVKFLQESNLFVSQHLYDFQSIPLHPERERITVLRPSKMVDTENFVVHEKRRNKQIRKLVPVTQETGWKKSFPEHSSYVYKCIEECPKQPTRIVILKPSPGKTPDLKAVSPSCPSSPRVLHAGNYFNQTEDVEPREAREMAKEITRDMRENLRGHWKDETVISSVFSNGYIGDDSSFDKSETEHTEGNLSDSEIMSPISRHSRDCINRLGSPYSSSSVGRPSFSPESSVCREAKKRLSERWAMVASNGSFQQQKHIPRSSGTLGEMLALSDMKKPVMSEEESDNGKLESRASTSCLSSGCDRDESRGDSPESLLRSKSVPVSSTASGTRLNVEIPFSKASKTQVHGELTESKNMKSFWKVSSLFSFNIKKAGKEKSNASQSSSESQLATPETSVSPAKTSDNAFPCSKVIALEECCLSPDTLQQQSTFASQEDLSIAKPAVPGNQNENQDQPSPISVLQPPFEEDDNMVADASGLIKLQGAEMSLKSNLIDKSPSIGSIARTLSWDDSLADARYSAKQSSRGMEQEEAWYQFTHTLLSAAGFDGSVQWNSTFAKSHSPESLLDPSLRDFANLNSKELIQDPRHRQNRSNRKLVFDYVNTALMEISWYGLGKSTRAESHGGSSAGMLDSNQISLPSLADHLWTQLKDWFSDKADCVACDGGDTNSLVTERAVRDDIVGRMWGENVRTELGSFGKDIEVKLMEELVEEAVIDFTGTV